MCDTGAFVTKHVCVIDNVVEFLLMIEALVASFQAPSCSCVLHHIVVRVDAMTMRGRSYESARELAGELYVLRSSHLSLGNFIDRLSRRCVS